MPIPKIPSALAAVMEEASVVAAALRSRGVKHFGRALLIALACVVGSRMVVYKTGGEKLARVQRQLDAARATAKYADTYRELDDNLRTFALRLPPKDHPEVWLLEAVRESMKAEGLVALSISPVQSQELRDFRSLSISVTCAANYEQLAAWIARMEGSRQLLHVASLTITKDMAQMGANTVQASIASLVPKDGGLP